MDRYNDMIQAAIETVDVWHGDCGNYYRADSGRVVTQYPFPSAVFRQATSSPDHDDYISQPGLPSPPGEVSRGEVSRAGRLLGTTTAETASVSRHEGRRWHRIRPDQSRHSG